MIVDIRQSIGPHVSLGTFWLALLERKIAQYARRADASVGREPRVCVLHGHLRTSILALSPAHDGGDHPA
jgi:hypothetical protein